MWYYEIVTNLRERGKFVTGKELVNLKMKEEQEYYRSYFAVDKEILKHIALGRKTAQGFIGEFHLPSLVLDIDKGKNSDEYTYEKAKAFYNRIVTEFEHKPLVFFSGRGYHFLLPDIFGFEDSNELPTIVKNTVSAVFPEADTNPINPRGLIRLTNSYNAKTGLYKVWLKNFEKIDLEEVLAIAKEPGEIPKLSKPQKLFPELIVKKKKILEVIPKVEFTSVFPCMQEIWHQGEIEGQRHNTILRLASWQRRNGTPQEATEKMMQMFSPSLDEYEIRRMVNDVYKKGYSYSCNDIMLKKHCKPYCIYYNVKEVDELIDAKDAEQGFHDYLHSNWKEKSANLIPIIGQDFYLPPQTFVGIIGATGLNKTALAQNIAYTNSHLTVLYVNTEFGSNILFRRFVQIAHGLTSEEVEEHYRKDDNHLSEAIKHIKFLNKIPDIDQLKQLVWKHKPQMLIVDVVDDIIKRGLKGLESEEAVAREFNDLAKQENIIVVGIHHIAKSQAYDDKGNPKPLNVFSSKGTASFPQKADILIAIEGKADDNRRVIRSLKARDNKPFLAIRKINPNTFKFEKYF